MDTLQYNHTAIEEKWLKVWEENGLFQGTVKDPSTVEKTTVSRRAQDDKADLQSLPALSKLYILFAFAYPSGDGLHVGHVESKTALDILARYYRMKGKHVFFPVGWDAFGLPAENYAVKTGVHPAETTKKAINTFRRQIKRLGISYDWETEIATSHPGYYKWTQWLFLQLYQKGLAYRAMGKVNWCPSCQTVLANEQVVEGKCERCGTPVIQKDLEQWYFKITKYVEELISGLDQVDWPAATKQQQLNWIGKRNGVRVKFQISNLKSQDGNQNQGNNLAVEVFTTRIDTIFGVTFMAVAPELVEQWMSGGWVASQEVREYVERSKHKTEEQRKIGDKEKSGVDTGLQVINPVNGEVVPVWVADYVLSEYGTGAVMGVPAHDERDKAFAIKFKLPIIKVIESVEAATDDGVLLNSGTYNGLTSNQAMDQLPRDFSQVMEKTTHYKLRDWLISRQRYWGAPIPIVYDPEGKPHPVKEEHLPWLLPTDVEFKPTGESPLTYSREFKERVEKLYGPGWRPEYDTMDTFVDSSWYYLRFPSARSGQVPFEKEKVNYWLPVDFYMIGPEHIVLHLLYSRFFTKFLRDEGYLTFAEPFLKMRHQGMILGPDHRKMSKSKGNVITPDEIISTYGADTLRLYEMFMGPIDADKPWDPRAVSGVSRFLKRLYRLLLSPEVTVTDSTLYQLLQETTLKVNADIPLLKFNTAIARLMELTNAWEEVDRVGKGLGFKEKLVVTRMMAPLAPFMAEEVWHNLSERANNPSTSSGLGRLSDQWQSVHVQDFPEADEKVLGDKPVTVVVQVNGKVRSSLEVSAQENSVSETQVTEMAKGDEKVVKWLEGKEVKRVVWVAPNQSRQGLLNFVVI